MAPSSEQSAEVRTWTSDLKAGDTVETGDGMLHRVVDVDLLVWIKPIAPTDAEMMGLSADSVKRWEPGR